MVLAGGSITDEVREKTNIGGETTLERQKRFCVSQGGKWDEENNRCIRLSELEAQKLKTRQAEAKETVTPIEPVQEQPTQVGLTQPQTEPTLPPAVDALIGKESPISQLVQGGVGGELSEEQKQTLATVVPAAGGALVAGFGAQAVIQAVAPAVGNFLSKFTSKAATTTTNVARGSRALGTNPRALGTNPRAIQGITSVLKAPAETNMANSILKTSLITGGTFFGLGQAKSIGSDLLLAESKKIRSKVGLVGEKLTKLPETSKHGFKIEDGVVTEYTPAMALKDIAEVEQTLFDARETLQQFSIGNAFLKLKGEHDIALDEVDKQLVEIGVAQSKVLEQIAVPSETQLAVKEFWEGVDLE